MILNADSVIKSFSQGSHAIEVLRGVDLQVAHGETVAVQGSSGSGKSTLLSLLSGLDHPDRGTVSIAGTSLASLGEKELTRFRGAKLGIVFQQFHLMSTLTALENVALPLEMAKDPGAFEKARGALAGVGLASREDHLPHQLSGGECQRVAIARAMVVRPALLLADEPSGNLDTRTGTAVMDLLFDLVKTHAMTMVLVTHNETLARRCHRRVELAEGRLKPLS